MAGIAFRLQRLLSGESYADIVRAYLYSAVIAAGPFMVAVATLGVFRLAAEQKLGFTAADSFMGLLVYAFGFSMLGTAPFMYVVTRYLADRYYNGEVHKFTPSFMAVLEVVFPLITLVCLAFALKTGMPLGLTLSWHVTVLSLSGVWIAMVFLSAGRSYLGVVAAFAVGSAVSVIGVLLCPVSAGLTGLFMAVAAGQAACFLVLIVRIVVEFGYDGAIDFAWVRYCREYYDLALIGVFYFAGIWVDKIVFWYSMLGRTFPPGLRLAPDYDAPMFFAYMTVVPSLAFFLVRMETSFARRYQAYYSAVRARSPIEVISARRRALAVEVAEQFKKFVTSQGVITGVIILMVYRLADVFALNPAQMGVFRIGLLGAFLQIGFVMCLNLLFYFDRRQDVLALTLMYFAVNLGATLATLNLGMPTYGFGYAVAGFVSLFAAVIVLNGRIRDLNYLTFMLQPIVIPRFKLEGEK